MIRNRLLIILFSLGTAACASTSRDVAPSIVPMATYDAFACQELADERDRINAELGQLSSKIDGNLFAERIKMGVGVTLFWPALLWIGDTTHDHNELARLKGARFTVRESMLTRGCSVPPARSPNQV